MGGRIAMAFEPAIPVWNARGVSLHGYEHDALFRRLELYRETSMGSTQFMEAHDV